MGVNDRWCVAGGQHGGVERPRGRGRGLFHDGDGGELFEGGEAGFDSAEGVFAKGLEDPVAGGDAEFVDGGFVDDGVADLVGDGEHFEDGESAFVAEVEAVVAADGGEELLAGEFFEAEAGEFLEGGFEFHFAEGAEAAEEALGEDGRESGAEEERFDAEVEEAEDAADGIAGVDGGEDEVAGHGGADGHLGGLGVADFADEDDIGVLAEEGGEGGDEGDVEFGVDLDLGDVVEFEFDGVFDGDDVEGAGVHFLDDGIDGSGFAGAGGSADDEHAGFLLGAFADLFEDVGVHAEASEAFGGEVFVEEAEDDFVAEGAGCDGDAEVHAAVGELDGEAAVLHDIFLVDVEVAEELDDGVDGSGDLGVDGAEAVEVAVHAVADVEVSFAGFKVDVGGAEFEAFEEELLEVEHGLGDFGVVSADGVSGFALVVEGDDLVEGERFGGAGGGGGRGGEFIGDEFDLLVLVGGSRREALVGVVGGGGLSLGCGMASGGSCRFGARLVVGGVRFSGGG